MSKLKAGEVAVWVTEQAIQILGGYGYIRDFPVEQWHRDSKIYTLPEVAPGLSSPGGPSISPMMSAASLSALSRKCA
jgi:hypothetical protein